MEILQFLLNNFLGDKLSGIKPIIELLRKNDFNLQKALSEMTPETLSPIIDAVSEFMDKNKSPTHNVGQSYGISPIAKLADKQIVYTLNRYLSD